MATSETPMRRFSRPCMFGCGRQATVLAPEGSDDLDVEAEFSSAGRSFSDTEDGDPVGVGCYDCSALQWRRLDREALDA